MAKARVTTTDALANVIEVAELGQRSGLLSVERGSGAVQETGEIYFVSGRPIYASFAGLRGREALITLSRWGACRFSFDSDAPQPAPNLSQQSSQAGQPGHSGYNAGATHGAPNHTPSSHPGMASAPYSNPASRPYESNAGWPAQTGTSGGSYHVPNTPSQYGGHSGGLHGGSQQGQAPQMAGPLSRRPRRAPDVRDLMTVVTTHNLSRGHRTLLLLADGEHSVLDLARLSSKSVDEVMALLAELEARSLIYYYG